MNSQVQPSERPSDAGVKLTAEEARAGATPHMTRYILTWGLGLVILGFVLLFLYYDFG